MRTTFAVLAASVATGAVLLLAGCSGGGSQSPIASLSNGNSTQSRAFHTITKESASGVAPAFLNRIHFGHKSPPPGPNALKSLYVSDFGSGAVEVLQNHTWTMTGSITSGLNGPDGDYVDNHKNLYVTNFTGINVQEYAAHSTSPTFTYSAGLVDPVGVTADLSGNVYVADYSDGGSGFVTEYAQGTNTPLATCSPGGAAEGVAVDTAGDVFVDYASQTTGLGQITEYAGGLSGCNGTTLGASVSFAGGMVIDGSGNLIICDQLGPTVDVIAPPYNSITNTVGSGYSDPFHVSLRHGNQLLFVADVSNANVQVLSYPSGSNLFTLGSGNGLVQPAGVADAPEATY